MSHFFSTVLGDPLRTNATSNSQICVWLCNAEKGNIVSMNKGVIINHFRAQDALIDANNADVFSGWQHQQLIELSVTPRTCEISVPSDV